MSYYAAAATDDTLVYDSRRIYPDLCLHFYKYCSRSYEYIICFSIQRHVNTFTVDP